MNGPAHSHPDTPITNKIIDDADAYPETRVVFLIKNLVNKCREFERALKAPLPELGTSSAAQELSALWDGRVPSDPAAAIAKMLGKLDEADKETFNWLAAGFRQVGANWAEARTARSTSGAWISAENKPERDGLYLERK